MPSDIIGINIYHKDTRSFIFKKGPIFNQIFLADEINRTSPRTQSSLLQAMEEGEISTEENHYILDQPFMVIATQNPLEYQGTFPLPEAQLDRFLMCISLGYPEKSYEIDILKNHKYTNPMEEINSVVTKQEVLNMQLEVDKITVHNDILDYIVNIANITRNYKDLHLGASPRASIDLLKAAKARAFLQGRNYVVPDDVKELVIPVLSHRLIPSSEARIERKSTKDILNGVLNKVFLPVIVNE